MNSENEAIVALKGLLYSFYPEKTEDLFRYLSKEQAEKIQDIEFKEGIDKKALFSKQRFLEEIHYSWFLPFLEKLPRAILPSFLSLFSDTDKFELKKILKIDEEKKESPFISFYFLYLLYKNLEADSVLPKELLPSLPINSLLKLSKKELILAIDLLGLYDLAYEMRQVVDKNLINKVRGIFSREELAFLDFVSKQAFKWIPPKLNIASFDGDPRKLKTLLHYRGLARLGFATFEEDRNFKYHLVHLLDIGRGNALLKLYAGKSDPAMIPYFKGQILDIIKRLPK